MMQLRRGLLITQHDDRLDTSPRIAEYGVSWVRGKELKVSNIDWCITEWYKFKESVTSADYVVGYIGDDGNSHTFQYHNEQSTQKDWYYFYNGDQEGRQRIVYVNYPYEISFSIYIPIIKNAYIYIERTGEILFAGKNTPYYGHTNISELN